MVVRGIMANGALAGAAALYHGLGVVHRRYVGGRGWAPRHRPTITKGHECCGNRRLLGGLQSEMEPNASGRTCMTFVTRDTKHLGIPGRKGSDGTGIRNGCIGNWARSLLRSCRRNRSPAEADARQADHFHLLQD